jgi:SAM-dependent methyltransferase
MSQAKESVRPEADGERASARENARPSLPPGDVAILETFVVPRYLVHFGQAALDMLLVGERARIAHFGCRTGYPDAELAARSESISLIGLDSSPAALELARNKARLLPSARIEYRLSPRYPTVLPDTSYSHALSLHPTGDARARRALFTEMARVLYSGGQALVSLPLRGSFPEAVDLFKEYALKHDRGDLVRRAEAALAAKATMESLESEMLAAGFTDVDVDVRQVTLSFTGGRAFTEDTVTRLFVVPETMAYARAEDLQAPLAYVGDAVAKYWSKRPFQLGLVVGTASGRKP